MNAVSQIKSRVEHILQFKDFGSPQNSCYFQQLSNLKFSDGVIVLPSYSVPDNIKYFGGKPDKHDRSLWLATVLALSTTFNSWATVYVL
jgi:hypothetical protein